MPVRRHKGGFTLLELVIAMTIMALIAVNVSMVTRTGSEAARGILPDRGVGHVGFTGTSLWLDPGRGRIYVLLSNRVHPEVSGIDFQAERREFHRIASRLTGANSGRPVE